MLYLTLANVNFVVITVFYFYFIFLDHIGGVLFLGLIIEQQCIYLFRPCAQRLIRAAAPHLFTHQHHVVYGVGMALQDGTQRQFLRGAEK